jgi:hypothetical protein
MSQGAGSGFEIRLYQPSIFLFISPHHHLSLFCTLTPFYWPRFLEG